MSYVFSHVFNSKNIRKLTPQSVHNYKVRYCYYSKKGGYYPTIVTVDRITNRITVQHESDYSNITINRAEELINNWLKKNEPVFENNVAYLIINNSSADSSNFVIDQNKNDPTQIEYDLLELMTSKERPYCLIMVSTDNDYPEIYYNYTSSIDVEALLIFDLFKDLSYTSKVGTNTKATNFMVEYIIEFYGLKPVTPASQLFLAELKNSKYVFPPHVTTEGIQTLYLESTMLDDYYEGVSTLVDERPTLNTILYVEGLLNVMERVEVENDTELEHFDYVVATPNLLYIYTLVEDPNELLDIIAYINDVMSTTSFTLSEYNVIPVDDKQTLESIKKRSFKNVSV